MDKTIFQIYLSTSADIPHAIKSCMENVQSHKGDYKYRLFHNEQVRDFIKDAYPDEVLVAYDTLKPFAYKADLARLCLLSTFGGWYFDSTVTLPSKLPTIHESIGMIVFKDAPNPLTAGNWNVNNGSIFARKEMPILNMAISQIVKNVKVRFYGRTSLDPTGPGLLGRTLAIFGPDRRIMTGWYHPLTPMHQIKNNAYLLPNGRILAYGKATAGTANGLGLTAYGDTGTNSYEHMYHAQDIYADLSDQS